MTIVANVFRAQSICPLTDSLLFQLLEEGRYVSSWLSCRGQERGWAVGRSE